jgi:hypothetical protein
VGCGAQRNYPQELDFMMDVLFSITSQLYTSKLKAARGASPQCILVKFRKISPATAFRIFRFHQIPKIK